MIDHLSYRVLTFDSQDPAFLDRIDKKQYIPEPCAEARYEILRTRYLALAECGILAQIESLTQERTVIDENADDPVSVVSPANDPCWRSRSSQLPCKSHSY